MFGYKVSVNISFKSMLTQRKRIYRKHNYTSKNTFYNFLRSNERK